MPLKADKLREKIKGSRTMTKEKKRELMAQLDTKVKGSQKPFSK